MSYVFAGIDPGLVHTGLVVIKLDGQAREIRVYSRVFDGIPTIEIQESLYNMTSGNGIVTIEAYKPRSHFQTDDAMKAGIHELTNRINYADVLPNTGVKKVVTQSLMERLGVWRFAHVTHHQDLRAAARIGIYGALRRDNFNAVITHFLMDDLDGRPWTRR